MWWETKPPEVKTAKAAKQLRSEEKRRRREKKEKENRFEQRTVCNLWV